MELKAESDSEQTAGLGEKNITKKLTTEINYNFASLNQQKAENGVIPARATFLASVCHVCKHRPRQKDIDNNQEHGLLFGDSKELNCDENSNCASLRACSGCHLIYYCSREHQRLHWPHHRQLCRAVVTLLQRLQIPHLCQPIRRINTGSGALGSPNKEVNHNGSSDSGEWRELRVARLQLLQQQLGRQMLPYERELVLYPRSCSTCHETRELSNWCGRCGAVFCCKPEHTHTDHSKWCRQLLVFEQMVAEENHHGLGDPTIELRFHCPDLNDDLLSYLCNVDVLTQTERVVAYEKASYPLTLLSALSRCWDQRWWSTVEQLTVHVVGAEAGAECFDLFAWEPLTLHMMPALKQITLVFVGLQLKTQSNGGCQQSLQVDLTCTACKKRGRRATCRLVPETAYHDYVKMSSTDAADIVCAFNAGLYDRHGWAGDLWSTSADSWASSLSSMLISNVPLLVTAYTLVECRQDLARIRSMDPSVRVVVEPTANKFASKRPVRNFVDEHRAPLVYKNNYLTCVLPQETTKESIET